VPPKSVTIVGIDASGKSVVVDAAVRALAVTGVTGVTRARVATLRFPALHETRDAPLRELSLDLRELSRIGDELGSGGIKATALYLLATISGPAQSFVARALRPRLLILERHAVIDVMAYSPLYAKLIGSTRAALDVADDVRREMAARRPGGMEAIAQWIAAEAERLGAERTLWAFPDHIARLAALPPDERLPLVERECQATTPDLIVWLDVDPRVAANRATQRGRAELHERAEGLSTLRGLYTRTLEDLRRLRPSAELQILAPHDGEPVEEVASRFLALFAQDVALEAERGKQ
jgi:thymidylate kinase